MNRSIRLALGALLLAAASTIACAADYVFVAHESGPDSLTRDEVKSILLGNKTRWDAGGIVKLAVLADGPVNDSVVQDFTARSADQFEKYWKKLVFTGKGAAPDTFKTDAELLAFVAKTPGSFGYVAAGTSAPGVKIVKVP